MKVERENYTQDIKLKIWDASGDKDMQNIVSLFVRDVKCCILVYSINSKISLD